MSWLKKYAKQFHFTFWVIFQIYFIRFEMQMDRPDKSENIFGGRPKEKIWKNRGDGGGNFRLQFWNLHKISIGFKNPSILNPFDLVDVSTWAELLVQYQVNSFLVSYWKNPWEPRIIPKKLVIDLENFSFVYKLLFELWCLCFRLFVFVFVFLQKKLSNGYRYQKMLVYIVSIHCCHIFKKNKNGRFIFDFFGSDPSKMDQSWSNLIKLDFSPI